MHAAARVLCWTRRVRGAVRGSGRGGRGRGVRRPRGPDVRCRHVQESRVGVINILVQFILACFCDKFWHVFAKNFGKVLEHGIACMRLPGSYLGHGAVRGSGRGGRGRGVPRPRGPDVRCRHVQKSRVEVIRFRCSK